MAVPNFTKRIALAADPEFRANVWVAMVRKAAAVMVETRTVDATHPAAYWDRRALAARDVLMNARGSIREGFTDVVVRYAILTAMAAVDPTGDDAQTQSVVDTAWDTFVATYDVPLPAVPSP